MAIKKIKILGAVLELLGKQDCQSSPFTSKLGQIDQIGSAQNGPQNFDFLTAMGAYYSFYVKTIAPMPPHF